MKNWEENLKKNAMYPFIKKNVRIKFVSMWMSLNLLLLTNLFTVCLESDLVLNFKTMVYKK